MYQTFHQTRIGASHIRCGLPCQDSSLSFSCPEGEIAIVADGHGNRKHFRSDRGSRIACEVARDKILAFLSADYTDDPDLFDEPDMNHQLTKLKQEIVASWQEAVREDFASYPWTEEELFEQEDLLQPEALEALVDGRDVLVAYGSTLAAAFTFEGGWAAVQVGDGCLVRVSRDGEYEWPMPESLFNEGNKTASLCMSNAMRDFRHCYGKDAGAGLLVFTDGIEKSFPSQGKEVTSLLHWILKNEQNSAESREENLTKTLDMITNRSVAGDDISVAGIIDPDAEDRVPKPSKRQKEIERERLLAQITEIESTIRYNLERIDQAKSQARDTVDVEAQMQSILERKKAAAEELWDKAEMLRIEIEGPNSGPAVPYQSVIDVPSEKVQEMKELLDRKLTEQDRHKQHNTEKRKKVLYEMLEMWSRW